MPKMNHQGLPEYTKADYRTLLTLLCPPEIYAKLVGKVIKKAAEGDMQAFTWLHEQIMKYAHSDSIFDGREPALEADDIHGILDDMEGEIDGYFVTADTVADDLPTDEQHALDAAEAKLKTQS